MWDFSPGQHAYQSINSTDTTPFGFRVRFFTCGSFFYIVVAFLSLCRREEWLQSDAILQGESDRILFTFLNQ